MKKTTVQWFCDKCGEEITDIPVMLYAAVERVTFEGCWISCVDVALTFKQHGDSDFRENIRCDRCKIEALEEVLNKLKAQKKEQSK